MSRGGKLILIYVCLNIIFIYVINNNIDLGVIKESSNPIISIIVGDPSKVIYDILYSIGVVLVLGAVLSLVHARISKKPNRYTLLILICLISIMIYTGKSILIACGVAGIIAGLSPVRDYLDKVYSNKSVVILSYSFGLLIAVLFTSTKKEMILYILCVTTLFFSLKCSYKYLKTYLDHNKLIALFSRYSLFIYLFHVLLLIPTAKFLLLMFPDIDPTAFFLILLSGITYISFVVTQKIDIANKNKSYFSSVYRAIFN